jgi:DNA-binding response OmpR family regulator
MTQVLDSENWRVHIMPDINVALRELATRAWTLVIVNVAMTGFSSPLYVTLKELSQSAPLESGKSRLPVLFVIPENVAAEARPILEAQRLSFVLKHFHLHDFLDKVSDLLMENETILAPIRHVRQDHKPLASAPREAATGQGAVRNTGMFANYADYSMTEEEINEYERQEAAETQRRKKKKLHPENL